MVDNYQHHPMLSQEVNYVFIGRGEKDNLFKGIVWYRVGALGR
jgi:hypothetical protein